MIRCGVRNTETIVRVGRFGPRREFNQPFLPCLALRFILCAQLGSLGQSLRTLWIHGRDAVFLLSIPQLLVVLMRFIPQDPTAHRFPIVDRRQTRRLAASSDATFSSGFGIGLPREFHVGHGVQGRAHAEHVTLRIGRNQVTRSHPERERLADVLFGLSLPCKHECRLSSPPLENFDLECSEERSCVQIMIGIPRCRCTERAASRLRASSTHAEHLLRILGLIVRAAS